MVQSDGVANKDKKVIKVTKQTGTKRKKCQHTAVGDCDLLTCAVAGRNKMAVCIAHP